MRNFERNFDRNFNRVATGGCLFAALAPFIGLSLVGFVIFVAICLLKHFGVDITPWN